MKKNKIFILLVLFVAFLIPSLTSCKKKDELTTYKTSMVESLKSVTALSSTITVKDQDAVVYEYVKTITINQDDSAYVKIDTKELDKNFNLSTKTTSQSIEKVNREEFLEINLKKEYFNKYSLDNKNFTGEISRDNMKNVFNTDITIKDIANLVITFENDKIARMDCTCTTETGKTMTLCTVYEY